MLAEAFSPGEKVPRLHRLLPAGLGRWDRSLPEAAVGFCTAEPEHLSGLPPRIFPA